MKQAFFNGFVAVVLLVLFFIGDIQGKTIHRILAIDTIQTYDLGKLTDATTMNANSIIKASDSIITIVGILKDMREGTTAQDSFDEHPVMEARPMRIERRYSTSNDKLPYDSSDKAGDGCNYNIRDNLGRIVGITAMACGVLSDEEYLKKWAEPFDVLPKECIIGQLATIQGQHYLCWPKNTWDPVKP